MDMQKALLLLTGGAEGIKEWNRLRANGEAVPNMAGQNLAGLDLSQADLSRMNLEESDVSGATLDHALLTGATMRRVDLRRAVLTDADLTDADLRDADLRNADLTDADLRDADLRNADLRRARLIDSDLKGAELSDAKFGGTVVATDLFEAKGLEDISHRGSSHLSFDSIDRFNGDLPRKFLRGCWPNERFIDLLTSHPEDGSEPPRSSFENIIYLGDVEMTKKHFEARDGGIIADEGAHVKTGNIQIIKNSVVSSDKLDEDLKEKLQQACQDIEDSDLPDEDKKAVAADVDSVKREMEKEEGERSPDRLGRFLNRIKELAPTAEAIIRSAGSVVRLLGLG